MGFRFRMDAERAIEALVDVVRPQNGVLVVSLTVTDKVHGEDAYLLLAFSNTKVLSWLDYKPVKDATSVELWGLESDRNVDSMRGIKSALWRAVRQLNAKVVGELNPEEVEVNLNTFISHPEATVERQSEGICRIHWK